MLIWLQILGHLACTASTARWPRILLRILSWPWCIDSSTWVLLLVVSVMVDEVQRAPHKLRPRRFLHQLSLILYRLFVNGGDFSLIGVALPPCISITTILWVLSRFEPLTIPLGDVAQGLHAYKAAPLQLHKRYRILYNSLFSYIQEFSSEHHWWLERVFLVIFLPIKSKLLLVCIFKA